MALKLITAPATEPISLNEAKQHCVVDFNNDDTLISSLIVAAREYCETYQNRAYLTQTWELILDLWPQIINLPMSPTQSVSSIKYKDYEGLEKTVEASDYIVDTDSEPARIIPAHGKTWPMSEPLQKIAGIRIRYVAGYSSAVLVPQKVKQAILLLVGHWYNNREALVIGNLSVSKEIEFSVKALLNMQRVFPI